MRLPSQFRRAALLLLLGQLAGCALPGFMSFPPQVRGNQIDPDQLTQLVPGTSTRADVTALFGTPTIKATFDDNTWLYIGEVTKPVIGGTQGVLRQQVVMLSFDDKGVLRSIARKTQADSQPVAVVSNTTPTPGSNPSILQQLIGNIGRFGPGGSSAATPSSSGY